VIYDIIETRGTGRSREEREIEMSWIVETVELKPGMVIRMDEGDFEVIALDRENAYDKYLPWTGRNVATRATVTFAEARYYGDNEVLGYAV